MKLKNWHFLIICLFLIGVAVSARSETGKKLYKCPPRIIRTCCSFGYNVGVWGIPFYRIGEVAGKVDVGRHKYLGVNTEGNGIIYTQRGGFVDLGHLRDQADWTAFLYQTIIENRGQKTEIKLGYEAGVKKLKLDIPADFSLNEAALLAGNITYYLSLWHEIATWYGASSIPLIAERYSAFSPEDDYSNRLGILLGMKSVESDLPYNEAMTRNITMLLDTLQAVETADETRQAMEAVHNLWWTRQYRYPNKKILLKREIPTFDYITPVLLPEYPVTQKAVGLLMPTQTSNGQPLSDFFDLRIKVNNKIPVKKVFNTKKHRIVSEYDFERLLTQIDAENSVAK
ncbi:MAG: DUF4056 domain-containing protein [Prolixibacteraceae bacterium]|jgi:hypothetical protein|nr:DUF4056 domain-containing protein [Prolixibacteraceae bacterium]